MKTTSISEYKNLLKAPVPQTVSSHPSMISDPEKRFLYWYTRNIYSGVGYVFDGGILLGGSTACFGQALLDRDDKLERIGDERPIWSYDRLITPKFSDDPTALKAVFERRGVKDLLGPGVSYEPLLRRLIKPYQNLVDLRVGDILTAKIPDTMPCEIAFLDILKTDAVDRSVFNRVFSNMIPGKTIVVQQDYFYDRLPYIRVRQERLSPYFRYIGEIRSTALFRLEKSIPEEYFIDDPVDALGAEERLRLVRQAANRSVDPSRRVLTELSAVRLALELFGVERAKTEFDRLQDGAQELLRTTDSQYLLKAHRSVASALGRQVAQPRIAAPAATAREAAAGKEGYWKKRKGMMYYRYIDALVRHFAKGATSLIDVGSYKTSYIENFKWIPERIALDIRKPYSSADVKGVKADFFDYEPDRKFDFALCLQTLEHIPDAKGFARKLLRCSDRVLISVPYLWPAGSNWDHVHDPVDLDKVTSWFGRKPDHHLVVTEPLLNATKASRLICYFQEPRGSFSLARAREFGVNA